MIYRIIALILLNIGFFSAIPPKRIRTHELSLYIKHAKKSELKKIKLDRILRHKPGYFKRKKAETIEVLKQGNFKMNYRSYTRVVFSFALFGFLVGIAFNNILMSLVLATGFTFIPVQFLKLKRTGFERMLNEQLETSLSIITNAYIQSLDTDILQAVKHNADRLEEPVLGIFREFAFDAERVDPNVVRAIYRMKCKVNNPFFHEWCNSLIQCQEDRDLKYVLPAVIEKMSDVKRMQAELDTVMYKIFRDYISVVAVVIVNIPLMRVLNRAWYAILVTTVQGKAAMALTCAVILAATAYVIKVNKPISLM